MLRPGHLFEHAATVSKDPFVDTWRHTELTKSGWVRNRSSPISMDPRYGLGMWHSQ